MRKIRWGVLSTARIGTEKVLPGIRRGRHGDVVAIASRSLERAQEAARRLGIAKAYGTYEALLADPDVDAVYNPLPNHLHVSWSVRALEAGKHVLCEKPIGLNVAEAEALLEAARRHPRLKVMEAFMYRFHPQWQRARQLVREGGLGPLRAVQTFFAYFNDDPANIRNDAAMGGGGLLDVGCYAVSLARFLFEAEPRRVCALLDYDPRFRVDRQAAGLLDFGGGAAATFVCGTQLARYQRVNIVGAEGRVEIEVPFNAPPERPCRLWHQHAGRVEEIVLEAADQYALQADAFAQAVLHDTDVPTPLEDAVANMRVIEALFRSADEGGWVETGAPG